MSVCLRNYVQHFPRMQRQALASSPRAFCRVSKFCRVKSQALSPIDNQNHRSGMLIWGIGRWLSPRTIIHGNGESLYTIYIYIYAPYHSSRPKAYSKRMGHQGPSGVEHLSLSHSEAFASCNSSLVSARLLTSRRSKCPSSDIIHN